MLSRVIVDGVKSIKAGEYPIEQYNLLLGKSGTNKSALIEAIVMTVTGAHPILGTKDLMSIATDIPPTDAMSAELVFDEDTPDEFHLKRVFRLKGETVSQTLYLDGSKSGPRDPEANIKIRERVSPIPFSYDVHGFVMNKSKDTFLFELFGDRISKITIPDLRNYVKVAVIMLCEPYVAIAEHKYGIDDLNDIDGAKAAEIVADYNETMVRWPLKSISDGIFADIDKIHENMTVSEYLDVAYEKVDTFTNSIDAQKKTKVGTIKELKEARGDESIDDIERELQQTKDERDSFTAKIDAHNSTVQEHKEAARLKRAYEEGLHVVLTDEQIKRANDDYEELEKKKAEKKEQEKKELKERDRLSGEYEQYKTQLNEIKKDNAVLRLTIRLNEISKNLERVDAREKYRAEKKEMGTPKKVDVEKDKAELATLRERSAVLSSKTDVITERYEAAKLGVCPNKYCGAKIDININEAKAELEKHAKELDGVKVEIASQQAKVNKLIAENNNAIKQEDRLKIVNSKLQDYSDIAGITRKKLEAEHAQVTKEKQHADNGAAQAENNVEKCRKEIEIVRATIEGIRMDIGDITSVMDKLNNAIANNDKYIDENAAKQKLIDKVKVPEISPFDENVIILRDKLNSDAKQLEDKREQLLGEKSNDSLITKMETEVLKLTGEAKFSRKAEVQIRDLKNRLLDKVLGTVRKRATAITEDIYGYPLELTTKDCGLVVKKGVIRDIRALSGGERTVLAAIILAVAMEAVDIREKLLIAEGAEMDEVYTKKLYTALIKHKVNVNYIMASNKVGIEVEEGVNIIHFT